MNNLRLTQSSQIYSSDRYNEGSCHEILLSILFMYYYFGYYGKPKSFIEYGHEYFRQSIHALADQTA